MWTRPVYVLFLCRNKVFVIFLMLLSTDFNCAARLKALSAVAKLKFCQLNPKLTMDERILGAGEPKQLSQSALITQLSLGPFASRPAWGIYNSCPAVDTHPTGRPHLPPRHGRHATYLGPCRPGATVCASAFSFVRSTEPVNSQDLVDGCVQQQWHYSVHALNPTWSRNADPIAPRLNTTTRRSRTSLPYILGNVDADQAFIDVCRLVGQPGPDGTPDLSNLIIAGGHVATS